MRDAFGESDKLLVDEGLGMASVAMSRHGHGAWVIYVILVACCSVNEHENSVSFDTQGAYVQTVAHCCCARYLNTDSRSFIGIYSTCLAFFSYSCIYVCI